VFERLFEHLIGQNHLRVVPRACRYTYFAGGRASRKGCISVTLSKSRTFMSVAASVSSAVTSARCFAFEEVPHGPFEHVQAIEPLHVVPSDYLLSSTILDVDGREVLAEMSVKPAEKR
jgi:hypothetical protein